MQVQILIEYLDEVTDLLNMPTFFVIAHSFGCTYALASYDKLKHKIRGAFRFLSIWAPSNLPCMPTAYSIQRSMPTNLLRALTSVSQSPTLTSLTYQTVPCQMGVIGSRERTIIHDSFAKEVLDRLGSNHLNDDFKAYELDWLLALEIKKPFGFSHNGMKCSVKCWHGMEDSISPLGAAMWMQREMDHFLLYAVEGATHNINLDMSIVKAVFSDICAEDISVKADLEKQKQESRLPERKSVDHLDAKNPSLPTDSKTVDLPPVESVWEQ